MWESTRTRIQTLFGYAPGADGRGKVKALAIKFVVRSHILAAQPFLHVCIIAAAIWGESGIQPLINLTAFFTAILTCAVAGVGKLVFQHVQFGLNLGRTSRHLFRRTSMQMQKQYCAGKHNEMDHGRGVASLGSLFENALGSRRSSHQTVGRSTPPTHGHP